MDKEQMMFVVYLIHAASHRWGISPEAVYELLERTDVISGYLVSFYDVLHTQGTLYLVEDLRQYLELRGVIIGGSSMDPPPSEKTAAHTEPASEGLEPQSLGAAGAEEAVWREMPVDGEVLERIYQEQLDERMIERLAQEGQLTCEEAMRGFYHSRLAGMIHRGEDGIQYLDYKVLTQLLMEMEGMRPGSDEREEEWTAESDSGQ